MLQRRKLEPTEYVLKGAECTGEESWNLPSMYCKEMIALEGEFEPTIYVLKGNKCSREESCNVPSMY